MKGDALSMLKLLFHAIVLSYKDNLRSIMLVNTVIVKTGNYSKMLI